MFRFWKKMSLFALAALAVFAIGCDPEETETTSVDQPNGGDLIAVAGADGVSVDLSWSFAGTPDSVKIYRGGIAFTAVDATDAATSPAYTVLAETEVSYLGEASGTTFTDTEVTGDTQYFYRVLAVNIDGAGQDYLSNIATITLIDQDTLATGVDTDGDGLSDVVEEALGTDPEKADSDGDGISDYDEVINRLDPLEDDTKADTDGDGLTNAEEIDAGTNPYNADSDGDGVTDGAEVDAGTDPLDENDYVLCPIDIDSSTFVTAVTQDVGVFEDFNNDDAELEGIVVCFLPNGNGYKVYADKPANSPYPMRAIKPEGYEDGPDGDDEHSYHELAANFTFYGQTVTSVYLNSGGVVWFDDPHGQEDNSSTSLGELDDGLAISMSAEDLWGRDYYFYSTQAATVITMDGVEYYDDSSYKRDEQLILDHASGQIVLVIGNYDYYDTPHVGLSAGVASSYVEVDYVP